MKAKWSNFSLAALLIFGGAIVGGPAMAIEEPGYELVRAQGKIEVRDYERTIVAEAVVNAGFENAGREAFGDLFDYISDNDIAMTAPVTQEALGGGWAIRFVMPEEYTLESLPEPAADNVSIKVMPPQRVAVIRYSGGWSLESYNQHLAALKAWIGSESLEITGDPIWARYNGPFTLWFLRRNEIHLPVSAEQADASAP